MLIDDRCYSETLHSAIVGRRKPPNSGLASRLDVRITPVRGCIQESFCHESSDQLHYPKRFNLAFDSNGPSIAHTINPTFTMSLSRQLVKPFQQVSRLQTARALAARTFATTPQLRNDGYDKHRVQVCSSCFQEYTTYT
jgi:hypothetical protein